MGVRIKGRAEHNIVSLTVIWFLGMIAMISTMWTGHLIDKAISYEGEIEAAVVALIGQQAGISLLALGALGAMLSSTSPKPPPPPSMFDPNGTPSTPVTVVNTDSNPVPNEPVVDETAELPVEEPVEVLAAPRRRRG